MTTITDDRIPAVTSTTQLLSVSHCVMLCFTVALISSFVLAMMYWSKETSIYIWLQSD